MVRGTVTPGERRVDAVLFDLDGTLADTAPDLAHALKTPLAVRSSSLLEDALDRPFAGVYETKMVPNNQADPDARFRGLVEAIKFVYASTYFRGAKAYICATERTSADEKMAVIIQKIVGVVRGNRLYPDFSGVARSHNFYPTAPMKAEDGIAAVALGLGAVGAAWCLLPRPAPGRWLAPLLLAPLLWPAPDRLPPGGFELRVFDIGHGLSVLVRTQTTWFASAGSGLLPGAG